MADKRKILIFCLFSSLIVNALLGGFIVSHALHKNHGHSPFDRMEVALQQVSPQYRAPVEELIAKHKENMRPHLDGIHASFAKIHEVLTAPTFDAQALKTIHTDMSQNDDVLKDAMETLMTNIAQTLPDEERIRFFKQIGPPPGPPPQ